MDKYHRGSKVLSMCIMLSIVDSNRQKDGSEKVKFEQRSKG